MCRLELCLCCRVFLSPVALKLIIDDSCVKVKPTISSRNFSTSTMSPGSFHFREVTFNVPRDSFCSRGSDFQGPCLPPPAPFGPYCRWLAHRKGVPRCLLMLSSARPSCPAPRPGSRRGPRETGPGKGAAEPFSSSRRTARAPGAAFSRGVELCSTLELAYS